MSKIARLPRVLALALVVALGGLVAYFGFLRGAADSTGAGKTTIAGLDEGLIGYWKFEGAGDRVVDSSGNKNDGAFINSTVTSGRYGQALKLSGNNDSHVSIPASPSLDDFADQITVSAWVFPATPPKGFKVIASRQIGALMHPDQFYLGFGVAARKTYYKWHLGTVENGTVNDGSIYVGRPASDRWVHMAGVYDGKKMRLYVNGKKIGDRALTGKIQVDDNPVTIGGEENGPESGIVDGEFDGQIDEVRIYNRALSSAEIKAIYRQPPF